MRTPGAATGMAITSRLRRTARGFTLIELMVVILLVGLLVSFAVLSVGGPSPRQIQHEEARRVLARMDLAREEAVMQARSLGVRFERDGYLFYRMTDGQWRMIEQGGLLDLHELPEAVTIDVEIDGLEVELFGGGDGTEDGDEDDEDDEDAVRPQLFFLAGGEIVPDFSIRILSADTDTEYRPRRRSMADAVGGALLMGPRRPARPRGFTLIEVLVALFVFAVAMTVLVQSGTQRAQNLNYLRDRTIASWIAADRITEIRLEPEEITTGSREGEVEMARRTWYWEAEVSATEDDTVRRIEVAVRLDEDGEPLSRMTGFVPIADVIADAGGGQ